MSNGFILRKPWATAIVCLIFSPFTGMLYLSRGKWAFRYMAFALLLLVIPFAAAHFSLIKISPISFAACLMIGLQIVGAVHGYFLTKYQTIEKRRWYSHWYYIILLVYILPNCFAIFFRLYLFEPFTIPTVSMEPTLNIGDYIFVNKRAYDDAHAPQRGDVVIFYVHTDEGATAYYIKRIAAIPGDKIKIQNGRLEVNGKSIQNGILAPNGKVAFPHTVDGGQYFMIGDNLMNSHDSRNGLGDISRNDIIGKAAAIVWNDKTYKFTYRQIK